MSRARKKNAMNEDYVYVTTACQSSRGRPQAPSDDVRTIFLREAYSASSDIKQYGSYLIPYIDTIDGKDAPLFALVDYVLALSSLHRWRHRNWLV